MTAQEAKQATAEALEIKEQYRQENPHPLVDEFVVMALEKVRGSANKGHSSEYISMVNSKYKDDHELEIQVERKLKSLGYTCYFTTMSWGRECQIRWD